MQLFQLYGYKRGIPFQHVTDARVAGEVLKSSSVKGEGLEKYLATPAWKPIISLESNDGDLWESMIQRFHIFMKCCPDPSKLSMIAKKNVDVVIRDGNVIDAEAIIKLTIASFIEFLFDKTWQPEFQIFIDASWEWRKEISIRGKGNVDVKQSTVHLITQLISDCKHIYEIFGDKWSDPEYYSIILQPFIISPSINVSDIMV
jgi:hypothetical protein